jgi:hypothetical protein
MMLVLTMVEIYSNMVVCGRETKTTYETEWCRMCIGQMKI